jgi:hypothetical protein
VEFLCLYSRTLVKYLEEGDDHLNGCEVWVLRESDKRFEISEMGLLKSVGGVTLLDKQQNKHVRERLNLFVRNERTQDIRHNKTSHSRSRKRKIYQNGTAVEQGNFETSKDTDRSVIKIWSCNSSRTNP